jgi:diguanylate cyclase
MRSDGYRRRRAAPLFAVYAVASLVPVALLGGLLASTYRADTNRAAMAEARSQASLLANDVVGPRLGSGQLTGVIPASAAGAITDAFNRASDEGRLLRLRIRDAAGAVVWSDDGSGQSADRPTDDDVVEAERGETVSKLTRLNADPDDVGPLGPRVVEIYEPIRVGTSQTQVGVLELYLPYAPIQQDVNVGLRRMYRLLAAGMLLLWVVLGAISASTTNHLRRRAQRLHYLAHHDVSSGLLNSEGFADALRRHFASSGATQPSIAVIDVCRFREINEALGRARGDEVLLELGRRFAVVAGHEAVVARLGGDEFGVAEFAAVDTELSAWAAKFQAAVGEPVMVDDIPVLVEIAIGYDRAEGHQAVDVLLVRADMALARAKSSVDRCTGYVEGSDRSASSVALLPRFRHAIAGGELELYYQPKTKLSDDRVVAVEALVRWNLDGELLPPGAFVPSIEQTTLVHPLTDWVARTALAQLISWGAATGDLHVAINVSARNVSDPGFASRLLQIVSESGVDPHRLIVEVTETALFLDPDAARSCLTRLHDAGIAVSIDDFGQGQTSLAYLAVLPVDELKIDRSFISRMVADPAHAAIVRSIIQLGHTLGLQVVAEGVETAAEHAHVVGLGADIAQGFLIARPMQAGAVIDWLAAHDVTRDRSRDSAREPSRTTTLPRSLEQHRMRVL